MIDNIRFVCINCELWASTCMTSQKWPEIKQNTSDPFPPKASHKGAPMMRLKQYLIAPSLRVADRMWKLKALLDRSSGPKLRLMAIFYPVQSPDVWTPHPSLTYTAELKLYVILDRLSWVGPWLKGRQRAVHVKGRSGLPGVTRLSISTWCPWIQQCLHKTVLETILQRVHPVQKS